MFECKEITGIMRPCKASSFCPGFVDHAFCIGWGKVYNGSEIITRIDDLSCHPCNPHKDKWLSLNIRGGVNLCMCLFEADQATTSNFINIGLFTLLISVFLSYFKWCFRRVKISKPNVINLYGSKHRRVKSDVELQSPKHRNPNPSRRKSSFKVKKTNINN